MKPQAQFRRILPEIDRLAGWYCLHRPQCQTISLRRAHWRAIVDHPEEARVVGFVVEGNTVTYRGFALSPTDCGASHGPA